MKDYKLIFSLLLVCLLALMVACYCGRGFKPSTKAHASCQDAVKNEVRLFPPSNLITVAKSGGDFNSVQTAIDSINDACTTNPYTVLIYPGIYEEQVNIRKSYVSLKGVSKGSCIIQAHPRDIHVVLVYNRDKPISNISIEYLTIKNLNSWGQFGTRAQEAMAIGYPTPTAHAVTNVAIKDCDLYGYQDTSFVYPQSKATFVNCLIDGGFDIASTWSSSAEYINCRFVMRHHKGGGAIYADRGPVCVINCWFESESGGHDAGACDIQSDATAVYFVDNFIGNNMTAGVRFERGVTSNNVYVSGNYGKTIYFDKQCQVLTRHSLKVSGYGDFKGGIKINGAERLDSRGFFRPADSMDRAAPNNSLYFSQEQDKLVFKDAQGGVHPISD